MKATLIIFLIIVMQLFACKSKSGVIATDEVVPQENENQIKGSEQLPVNYDVIVSFLSKGAGVDRKIIESINKVIVDFSKKNNVEIMYDKVGWGREGEMDYNFTLKNLSTTNQKDFIKAVDAVVSSSDMANIKFNKSSVHKR